MGVGYLKHFMHKKDVNFITKSDYTKKQCLCYNKATITKRSC